MQPVIGTPLERSLDWLRKRLFATWYDSLFTLLAIYVLVQLLPPLFDWALFKAHWVGSSREACSGEGACWVFVSNRLHQFLYGFYPEAERWRVNLTVLLGVVGGIAALRQTFAYKRLARVLMLAVYPPLAFLLLAGGAFGLAEVETSRWGGLMLTLVIAVTGIAGALPGGILLALGRRSSMPVIRLLCITFIEFWRGVPLITVLFMSSVMLPLFLPEGMSIDKLLRALVGVILFQSAYIAEVVRGGLQAIPKGQTEAAQALGLGYWQCMGLIVLPQALRLVIPGIVNTLIALFKDTSLVIIIGLFDLMNTLHAATVDPNWLGFATEGYVFIALVYWLFCFGMSRYSQRLERRLRTGHHR